MCLGLVALKTRRRKSKRKRVANGSPVTHQTPRQQGGTGEDGHIHLADWTLSVVAIEMKSTKY